MSSISDFLGQATSIGSTALNQLSQGNVGDAISTIIQGPGSLLGTIGARGGTTMGDDFKGINSRGDAIQNWCWYAVMPDVTNSGASSIAGIQPSVSLPWYYVQTANLPFRTFSVESVKRNGHDVHNPTSYTVSSLTLGLFMDSANKAHKYLKTWQGLVMGNNNPKVVQNQGVWGYPASYKKDITIVVLSVDRKVLLNVKLINCWPSDPAALSLVSGESGALVQDVTFACEDVDVTVNNDKGLLDSLISTGTGYATGALVGAINPVLNNLIGSL